MRNGRSCLLPGGAGLLGLLLVWTSAAAVEHGVMPRKILFCRPRPFAFCPGPPPPPSSRLGAWQRALTCAVDARRLGDDATAQKTASNASFAARSRSPLFRRCPRFLWQRRQARCRRRVRFPRDGRRRRRRRCVAVLPAAAAIESTRNGQVLRHTHPSPMEKRRDDQRRSGAAGDGRCCSRTLPLCAVSVYVQYDVVSRACPIRA